MIVFDDTALKVTVSGVNVFGGGDHVIGTYMPGIYYIEVEAYSGSNVATGTKIDMTVTVTDPCDKPNGITIKPGIFSPNPIVYQIYGTQIDLTLAPQAGITVDESEQTINCPLIEFFVVNTGVTNPAPLTTLYTWTQAT